MTNKTKIGTIIPISISLCFILYACDCSWDYDEKDFEFSKEELSHLGPYKVGDTIYFKSNLGDTDTITIMEVYKGGDSTSSCLFSIEPSNHVDVLFKHLPVDRWQNVCWNCGEDGGKTTQYQYLISVAKFPLNKRIECNIVFRDFLASGDSITIGKFEKNCIINDVIMSDCYKLEHKYRERVVNPKDIELVYWTDKYGLTAYTNKGGETWLIKQYNNKPISHSQR